MVKARESGAIDMMCYLVSKEHRAKVVAGQTADAAAQLYHGRVRRTDG